MNQGDFYLKIDFLTRTGILHVGHALLVCLLCICAIICQKNEMRFCENMKIFVHSPASTWRTIFHNAIYGESYLPRYFSNVEHLKLQLKSMQINVFLPDIPDIS